MNKFRLKIFLYFIFFFNFLNSIQYKNVIEICFKPEIKSLENSIKNDSCPLKTCAIQSQNPLKKYSNNPADSDGFNIYYKEQVADDCRENRYCVYKKILNRSIYGVPGVFCFYNGYSALSDDDGLVIFPSLETNDELIIVVSKSIYPILFSKNIPSYFKVNPEEPSAWYKLSKEKKNKNSYWEIKKMKEPEDLRIPENALIIIGEPNYVRFDKEEEASIISQNIIVPNVYLDERFTRGIYTLDILDNLKYYSPEIKRNVKEKNNFQYAKLSQ